MKAKRERGLKPLPDGRCQWSYQDPGGKYHRHIAGSKGEARAYLEKKRTEIREGRFLDRKREDLATFEEAVKEFLKWSKNNKRAGTYDGDQWAAGLWLESRYFAGKPVAKITGADVEHWRQDLATRPHRWGRGTVKEMPGDKWRASWVRSGKHFRRILKSKAEAEACIAEALQNEEARPISKRTQDIALARLKRMFALRVELGFSEHNPAAKAKLYREDAERLRFLTDEEEERLLAACPAYLARTVRFAILTGARRGEILGIRWADVDFPNRVATLPGTMVKGRRARHIYLNEGAVQVLNELPRPIDSSTPVFALPVTKRPKAAGETSEVVWQIPARMEQHWQSAVDAAGLGDFHFHDLRHTFASRLVQNGVDLAVLRELLGHRDFKMTLRYAHLAPSHAKAAVAVLDSLNLQKTCNAKTAPLGAASGNSSNPVGIKP